MAPSDRRRSPSGSSWFDWARGAGGRGSRQGSDESAEGAVEVGIGDTVQDDREPAAFARQEGSSDPFDVVLSWPDAGPDDERPVGELRGRGRDEFDRDADTGALGSTTREGVPILPLMAAQIESILASLRTLEVRVDGIVNSVSASQHELSERIAEHVEAMARTMAEQSVELQHHQQRLDSATTALHDALADDEHVPELAEQLATLAAEVGAAGSFREAVQGVRNDVAELVDAVASLPDAARIEQALVRVASVAGSDAGLSDEVNAALQAMRDDLARLTDFVVGLPDAAQLETVLSGIAKAPSRRGSNDEVLDTLMGVHDELAQLKRRIPVRAKTTVRLDDDQIDAVARAVLAELESRYDLVSEPEPPSEAAPSPAVEDKRRRRRR